MYAQHLFRVDLPFFHEHSCPTALPIHSSYQRPAQKDMPCQTKPIHDRPWRLQKTSYFKESNPMPSNTSKIVARSFFESIQQTANHKLILITLVVKAESHSHLHTALQHYMFWCLLRAVSLVSIWPLLPACEWMIESDCPFVESSSSSGATDSIGLNHRSVDSTGYLRQNPSLLVSMAQWLVNGVSHQNRWKPIKRTDTAQVMHDYSTCSAKLRALQAKAVFSSGMLQASGHYCGRSMVRCCCCVRQK